MTQRVIAVGSISVLLACALAHLVDLGAAERARESAVLGAEELVFAIAEQGPAALLQGAERSDLRRLAGTSPLFALLGAWSKLSLGRLGLLGPEVAARLPWLVVAGLAPAALFALVAGHWGARRAGFAAAWLWAFPGWALAAARGSEGAALAGAWLVALALYQRSEARPGGARSHARLRWSIACAVWLALTFAMSRAVLGVLAILPALFAVRKRPAARSAEQRGYLLVPDALVYSIVALPIGLVAFNPALYGAPAPAIVGAVFAPLDSSGFHLIEFAAPAGAAAGAWLSFRLARRFLPDRYGLLGESSALTAAAVTSLALAVLAA